MTIRGGVRSLNARLARLEQHIPEPRGPIEYRVLFHDGAPLWPRPEDGTPIAKPEVVFRIASWEEALFNVPAGTVRRSCRANARW